MSAIIEKLFKKELGKHTDIHEHLGLLRGFAMQCETVVELGFRTGISTLAFLAGGATVHSYDIKPCPKHRELKDVVPNRFFFCQGDSLKVDIPKCDMLFIDTYHSGIQLLGELRRHMCRPERWIVIHDTKTWGDVGQDGKHGLNWAIDKFLSEACHSWRKLFVLMNNNGLTVLDRI